MATQRIVSLQILRFVAASGVIALHAWEVMTPVGARDHPVFVAEFGPGGVDLFFVISGYIITKVSAGTTAMDFLARRFSRILPLYWILTGATILLYIAIGKFDPRQLIPSFLFVPTLGFSPYIKSGWTLCFELLFYACFSAVLLSPKRGIPIALGVFGAAMVGREVFGGPVFQFIGNPLILEFLAGCLIAVLPRSRAAVWLCAAGSIAWGSIVIATGYEMGQQSNFSGDAVWSRILMLGGPAALLVYSAVHVRVAGSVWEYAAYLGDASFSAYLIHEFLLIFLALLHAHVLPIVGILLTVVSCWLLAIIVHEGLEKPLLALFRRPRQQAKTAAIAAAPTSENALP